VILQETDTVIYSELQNLIAEQPRFLNLLMAHLDSCKDVCDHFGITTSLVPFVPTNGTKVTGFTVKSFRNPDKLQKDDNNNNSNNSEVDDLPYDPFWDDGTDFDNLYQVCLGLQQ
jgi:hypothetical protein